MVVDDPDDPKQRDGDPGDLEKRIDPIDLALVRDPSDPNEGPTRALE